MLYILCCHLVACTSFGCVSAHLHAQQLCRVTESYGLLVHCVVTLDCVLAQDKEPAAEDTKGDEVIKDDEPEDDEPVEKVST